jgi:hypothetical protein
VEWTENPSVFGLRIIEGVLILLTYLSSLMRTGQKDVLVEGPSVLNYHGKAYCSPDAQMRVLHMSLHGALMLEGSPTLMWTGQENVMMEGLTVLSYHGEGPLTHLMSRCISFTCHCMVL